MADYDFTLTDGGGKTIQQKEDGITAAREARNANVPVDEPGPHATNQEYIQFVFDRATVSYATQYNT